MTGSLSPNCGSAAGAATALLAQKAKMAVATEAFMIASNDVMKRLLR